MKTTLAELIMKSNELERKYSELLYKLRTNCTNEKAIELDGKEQILEEHSEFLSEFNKLIEIKDMLNLVKAAIFKRNNELTLSNGETIQNAINVIHNERKLLELYKNLADKKETKKRQTENYNSYFISVELAYDKERIKEHLEETEKLISLYETEIAQLNAIPFEVEFSF